MNRTSSGHADRTTRQAELLVELDRKLALPLRRQLAEAIRALIRQGRLPTGTRLPSTRVLALEIGVSRGTVVDAYGQLAAEGYLELRSHTRPVVRAVIPGGAQDAARPPAPRRWRYDLVATTPDLSLFPRTEWTRALRKTLARIPDRELDYEWSGYGTLALREELADYLGRVRGVLANSEQVLVTNGFKHGLDITCRVLAAQGARKIAVEDPSFDEQWDTIRRNGLEVVPIPVDEGGLRVDELLRLTVDAVVVTPAHQFPTGAVLLPKRRRLLLEWAHAKRILVLEDDYDAEYRYDRAPVGTLQGLAPSRVIYLGTGSKTFAPALRIGWLVAPISMVAELSRARWASDAGCRPIDAYAYAELLSTGEVDRHLRKTRPIYRRRRELLALAISKSLPEGSLAYTSAGLHTVLHLPPTYDENAIVLEAETLGIRIRSLSSYRIAEVNAQAGLVIGFGRLPEAAIEPAVQLLASAICASLKRSAPTASYGED